VSDKIVHVTVDDRASLLAQAQSLFDAGDLERADDRCRTMLDRYPRDASALHLAAVIAQRRQEFVRASDLLSEAIEQEPMEARHLFAMASVLHALGRDEESFETLEWAEVLEPNDPGIQFSLGMFDQQGGATESAARRFRKVLAIDPENAPSLTALGKIYASSAATTAAHAYAMRIAALPPEHPAAFEFVFETTLAKNPAAATRYLTNALHRYVASTADVDAAIALCWSAHTSLSSLGLWTEAFQVINAYGIFREAWWRQILQSTDPALVVGPRYLPHRIGELGANLVAIAKARILGWFPDIELLLPVPAQGGANPAYLEYWRPWFTFLQTPGPADEVARPGYGVRIERDGTGRYHDIGDFGQVVENAWAASGRPPLLTVTTQHRNLGQALLREWGVPSDAWFVVLHVRDSAYMAALNVTDKHNDHRNSNILDYLEAVRLITDRGGWVLRIGHARTRPLPDMERVIDVAHRKAPPELDVFLLGTCRFFLGDTSGPYIVATTFGRPVVAANFQIGLAPCQPHDLYIPKLYRDTRSSELVSFRRSLAPPLFRPIHLGVLAAEHVEPVDNSPQEIADLTRQMLDWLDGGEIRDPADDIAQDLAHRHLPEGAIRPNARMGKEFLRAYRHLLD
jgi:putative glycosyltransferase (TIGR04372 family)